jgi:cytidylate kinase
MLFHVKHGGGEIFPKTAALPPPFPRAILPQGEAASRSGGDANLETISWRPEELTMPFEVIALDGPGGVGKSTTGRILAERLGYFFLSSGAIYRALAWMALQRGWKVGEKPDPEILEGVRVTVNEGGVLRINGKQPGDALIGEEISMATSHLSTIPEVRDISNEVQRDTLTAMASAGVFGGVILEGRDIGTVVFPEARHKIFLTASVEERARRRFQDLKSGHPELTLEEVMNSLQERDQRDASRDAAPMKPARDAFVLDTSAMTREEVLQALLEKISGGGIPIVKGGNGARH